MKFSFSFNYIRRGVRQGCIISPLLFNLCSEYTLKAALNWVNGGVKINYVNINYVRYADDTSLLTSSLKELNVLIDSITKEYELYGLKFNPSKTKYMVVSKQLTNAPIMTAYCVQFEKTDKITYLGSNINNSSNMSKEIKIHTEKSQSGLLLS